MSARDDEVHVRLSRIRDRRVGKSKPFVHQVLRAAKKAGAGRSAGGGRSGCHLEPPPRCSRRRGHCVPLEGLSHQRPRPLEDHAASPARVHQALPDACAAQRLPPHPPLRALCQRQPRQQHRDSPRSSQRRPACRRPASAARHRSGRDPCAALPMPALWRAHDRDRGVRTRLRAEVASHVGQDRHVMTQTSRRPRNFQFRSRWLHAGSARSRSDHNHQHGESLLMRSEHAPRCPLHAPNLACDPIRRSHPVCVPSTVQFGAGINSP